MTMSTQLTRGQRVQLYQLNVGDRFVTSTNAMRDVWQVEGVIGTAYSCQRNDYNKAGAFVGVVTEHFKPRREVIFLRHADPQPAP